jgi:hypothetical protein
MRKLFYTCLAGVGLIAIGLRLLMLGADHISTGSHDSYAYLSSVGAFLLFIALGLFFSISAIMSRKLRTPMVMLTGIVLLPMSVVVWKILLPSVNVHYWTFALLVIPLIMLLCGVLFLVVGSIRWAISSSPR